MTRDGIPPEKPPTRAWTAALGGLCAMAAALGIGRFVYTPILPAMLAALHWSTADAGVVASANFLGYLAGAVMAGRPGVAAARHGWLVAALTVSAATTAATGATADMATIAAMRFAGGVASAFVIVCASTVVLEELARHGRSGLAAVHFSGVGAGIVVSAAVVAALEAAGWEWRGLWAVCGALAAAAGVAAAVLLPGRSGATAKAADGASAGAATATPVAMVAAYGLFGFGYVITATFLVAMVRQTDAVRPLEPFVWVVFGAAAVPSMPLWQWLGRRIGVMAAFAVAAVVEAVGVAAGAGAATVVGVGASAVLLGGTFMGLTALGLMTARVLGGVNPQRLIGVMTVSFGAGQMAGPWVAGVLAELTGSLWLPSLIAAAVLVLAAALALRAQRGAAATG